MSKHVMPIAFIITLLPVIGFVWFLLFQDDAFVGVVMQIPLVGFILFVSPMILFGAGVVGAPMTTGIVLALIPLVPAVILGFKIVRSQDTATLRQWWLPIGVVVVITTMLLGVRMIWRNMATNATYSKMQHTATQQRDILEKTVHIRYQGSRDDMSYDHNEQVVYGHVYVTETTTPPTPLVLTGRYRLCITTQSTYDKDPCIVQSSIYIDQSGTSITWNDDFQSSLLFHALYPESLQIRAGQPIIILPGRSEPEVKTQAFLHLIYQEPGVLNDKSMFVSPLQGRYTLIQ